MTKAKHGCAARVYGPYSFRGQSCQRAGKNYENKKWWCFQHTPSNEQKRRKQNEDAYLARCHRTDLLTELHELRRALKVKDIPARIAEIEEELGLRIVGENP